MANTADVQVVGLKELVTKLENLLEIGGKPSKALDSAGRKAWNPTKDEARELLVAKGAIDTWALYDSLAVTVKRDPATWGNANSVHVSGLKIQKKSLGKRFRKYGFRNPGVKDAKKLVIPDPRRYWHFVEFGTSHSAAKSYIRAAVDPALPQVLDRFTEALSVSVGNALAKQTKVNGTSFE